MAEQSHSNGDEHRRFFSSRGRIVVIGFLLIAGYFLVTEHSAHLALAIPYLPFLLLLACPLMHVFMHHGHHHHHQDTASNNEPKPIEKGSAS